MASDSDAMRRQIAAEMAAAFPLTEVPLSSGAIVARPLEYSDAPTLLEVMGGDPAMTWTRREWDIGNVEYLLRIRIEHYRESGFGVYALVDAARGAFLGMAGLQFWEDVGPDVEVIAYVRRDRWAEGIASTTLRWSVAEAFERCPSVGRVLAATRHDNKAAQAVARSLGMVSTGEGEHYGAPSIFWELSREDWQTQRT